jgi:hypothetical protein
MEIIAIIFEQELTMMINSIGDEDIPNLLYSEEYSVVANNDWTGFYDWLRNSEKKIIGIRYCPFEETEFICSIARELPYSIVSKKNTWVEFYFSKDREYVSEFSADQQFTGNWILRSPSGKYAITFRIDIMNESDRQQILSIPAHWVETSIS